MQRFQQTIQHPFDELKNSILALSCDRTDVCVFDIETTGLSPKVSSVYLIGAAWFHETYSEMSQWFADDYISEKDLLVAFAEFLSSFRVLVHYNGTTFDLPYLEKKYAQYQLPSPFSGIQSIDLFTDIRRQKTWFPSPNRKLSTMEKLLGFSRRDNYTGKDCIALYTEYMKKKVFRDKTADDCRQRLLLHNHDDLIGTILCCQFLYYTKCNPTQIHYEIKDKTILLHASIPGIFPISWERDISCGKENPPFHIDYKQNRITISIPLYCGTLRHFYRDYKNYFYLPAEDTAIHKSVGIYVDQSRREKATASNCYTKKTGTFLPLPKKDLWSSRPHFQEEKKSPAHFIYLETDFSISDEQLTELFAAYCSVNR